MSLGEKIYRLRMSRGLSQDELAEILNVSRQTISNWENDKVTIDIVKTAELCAYFDITVDELISENSDPTTRASRANTPSPHSQKSKRISLWLCLSLCACCFVGFVTSIALAFTLGTDEITSTITSTGSVIWIVVALLFLTVCAVSLCIVIRLYKKSTKSAPTEFKK